MFMPGVTKRKYEGELIRFQKSINRPLGLVSETLKPGYSGSDLLEAFRRYYPCEWDLICERYRVYKEKDKFLVSNGKKIRYRPLAPEKYFFSLPKVKYLLACGYREKHMQKYDEINRKQVEEQLYITRSQRFKQKKERVKQQKINMQMVEPIYIDVLIFAYHKKGNFIEDKIEIFKEIQKYDCEKATQFFYKLNDSERNNQIRTMAFQHLQKTGHYVRLRKNYVGKQKKYMVEKSDFYVTPQDLAKRLDEQESVQNRKHYDIFISHSSKDAKQIRQIIHILNEQGLVCYCDWTSDSDFLKRSMVSDYTKEVLKKRLLQSNDLLFISSENSRNSEWVNFELDYYRDNGKGRMFIIQLDENENKSYNKLVYDKEKECIIGYTRI